MKATIRHRSWSAARLLFALSCVFLVLPACKEDKDPSYEKEALKLSAEKAALEVRLEESKKQVTALQARVQGAEAERDAIKEKASQSTGKIDPEKIKLGFAKAMADLEKNIEKNFPHLSVKSWTVQKMNVQTDYPFTSGVMTTLANKTSGTTEDKYWEAKGNIKGEWLFSQTAAPKPVARRNTLTPHNTTASNPPSGQPAQPNQPARPTQPRRPKPATNGKTHVIDWGTLR